MPFRRAKSRANPVAEMPFLDHLEELRWKLLRSLIALAVGAVVGFLLVTELDVLGLLIRPLEPFLEGGRVKYLSPSDPFVVTLKLALTVGVILAFPVIVHQAWTFVSPALMPHERRAIIPSLYLGLVLFVGGVALAYFAALPITLRFMLGFQTASLEQSITIGPYMAFIVKLLIGFGVIFELPVVMLVLAALGLVDSKMLASKRRWAIVGITIASSVITPGDVILLTAFMMVPMLLLYELSIVLTKLVERRRAAATAAEPPDTWVEA